MKSEINPMQLADASRCGARTRSGAPCQSPPVHGKKRCRMHGGTSPGAPRGNRNALKTGAYTREALTQKREARAILKALQELLKQIQLKYMGIEMLPYQMYVLVKHAAIEQVLDSVQQYLKASI